MNLNYLYRHKDIQRRIPGTLVHIGIDWERTACLIAVNQFVDSILFFNICIHILCSTKETMEKAFFLLLPVRRDRKSVV